MNIIVTKNYQESCEYVAGYMADLLNRVENAKLGLATGGTAEVVYKQLIELYNDGKIDFSNVSSVNLDEYIGIGPEHEQSYRKYMNMHFFDHINIDNSKTHVANGLNNPEDEIALFNEKLYGDKGLDFQLLGVGVNGHIGFNEARSFLTSGAHIEDLDQSTIDANARYFDKPEDVPTKAITMGVGDILKAKEILLVASGDSKIDAITKLITNDHIITECPATLLKLHNHVTIVIDEDLAKKCNYKG